MSYVNSFKRTAAMAAVGAAAAGVAVVGMSSGAWAAPTGAKNAVPVTADCGGQPYSLVINGGGNGANSNNGQTFNAAHFTITSDSLFVPVAFGESTFSEYINGVLVQSFTQPPTAKGNGNASGPANATTLSCTYSFSQAQTDPTTGDVFKFTGAGSVVGFVPGSQSGS